MLQVLRSGSNQWRQLMLEFNDLSPERSYETDHQTEILTLPFTDYAARDAAYFQQFFCFNLLLQNDRLLKIADMGRKEERSTDWG